MTEKELTTTLDLHKTWISSNRAQGLRANLASFDLSDRDLSYSELSYAKLSDTNLHFTDLRHANLAWADLYKTDLSGANLTGANLRHANLTLANLSNANLTGANLDDAILTNANLSSAYLHGAKGSLIEYRKGKILTEDIIGYKKCREDVIVTLCIPRGAIVFSINGYKCRTNKARVIAIDGDTRAISICTHMSYYVGDEFTIYDFDCEYNVECGAGIHFFMDRKDAENYF